MKEIILFNESIMNIVKFDQKNDKRFVCKKKSDNFKLDFKLKLICLNRVQ